MNTQLLKQNDNLGIILSLDNQKQNSLLTIENEITQSLFMSSLVSSSTGSYGDEPDGGWGLGVLYP